jgi:hypothetical protein
MRVSRAAGGDRGVQQADGLARQMGLVLINFSSPFCISHFLVPWCLGSQPIRLRVLPVQDRPQELTVACVVITDGGRSDPDVESSVVNVLVGEGLATVRAVAKANLRQPRDTSHARTNRRGVCGRRASAKMAKTTAVGEETAECTRSVHRGPGDGTYGKTRGLNWGPTRRRRAGGTKQISLPVSASGSDEALVSDDPTGQHNRLASQGPLDGIVPGSGRGQTARFLPFGVINPLPTNGTLVMSKRFGAKGMVEFPFEAVLGKTRRTEFQRGWRKHRGTQRASHALNGLRYPATDLRCVSTPLDGKNSARCQLFRLVTQVRTQPAFDPAVFLLMHSGLAIGFAAVHQN